MAHIKAHRTFGAHDGAPATLHICRPYPMRCTPQAPVRPSPAKGPGHLQVLWQYRPHPAQLPRRSRYPPRTLPQHPLQVCQACHSLTGPHPASLAWGGQLNAQPGPRPRRALPKHPSGWPFPTGPCLPYFLGYMLGAHPKCLLRSRFHPVAPVRSQAGACRPTQDGLAFPMRAAPLGCRPTLNCPPRAPTTTLHLPSCPAKL